MACAKYACTRRFGPQAAAPAIRSLSQEGKTQQVICEADRGPPYERPTILFVTCKLATLITPRVPPPCSRKTARAPHIYALLVYRMRLISCLMYARTRCVCLKNGYHHVQKTFSVSLDRQDKMMNLRGHWVGVLDGDGCKKQFNKNEPICYRA